MQRPALTVFALLSLAGVLAGCSTPPPVAPVPTVNPVDALISKTAAEATAALRELSETTGASRAVTVVDPAGKPAKGASATLPVVGAKPQAAATIAGKNSSVVVDSDASASAQVQAQASRPATGAVLSNVPAGMEKLISVQWTGDLELLIATVAKEIGWQVAEPSGLRISPVIVSVQAERRMAYELLRDIGAIAGANADVVVTAGNKTIGIRYPKR